MKHLCHTLLLCCITLQSFAQRDSILAAHSPASVLTLGVAYGNTVSYYGQNPEDKLPYLLFYAGYNFKKGFSLSSTAQRLLNSGTGISAIDVYAGYSFKITENFTGNLGYSHYFYQKDSPFLQSDNQNALSGNLTYNWNIKSGLSASYSFGSDNDIFLSFRNSKMIYLGNLFSEKGHISIEPAVDLVGGTVHFYETYTTRRDKRRERYNLPPKPLTTTIESTSFGIMAYTFSLPLAYNRASYTVEASYQTSVAGKKFSSESGTSASSFSVGFYYAF